MNRIPKSIPRFHLFLFLVATTTAAVSLKAQAQTFPYWADSGFGAIPLLGSDDRNIYYEVPDCDGFCQRLYRWNPCEGSVELHVFGGDEADEQYISQVVAKGNYLYIVGQLQIGCNDSVTATNIVKYNLATGEWSSLGYTPPPNSFGTINSVAIDANGNVYVALDGSDVNFSTGIDPNALMKYDGSSWTSVGGGMQYCLCTNPEGDGGDNWVHHLATDGTNIFAEGGFVGGYNGLTLVQSPLLIKWDGSQWCSMGGIVEGGDPAGYLDVSARCSLAVLGTNVFVTGNFYGSATNVLTSGAVNLLGIARFSTVTGGLLPCDDITQHPIWMMFESESSLAVHSNTVYVAGDFSQIGSTSAYGIGQWIPGTGQWSDVGGGLIYQGNAGAGDGIAATTNLVLVTGNFDQAGSTAINQPDAALWITGEFGDSAPSGMAAWWRAENNTDDSIGANNGTITGGVTYTNGEVGQAFFFDGTSGHISIPASSSLDVGSSNGLTIECWIWPNHLGPHGADGRPIVEWDNSSTVGTMLWFENQYTLVGNLRTSSGVDHVMQSAPGTINTNVWQHVAETYDKASGNAYLYINGVQVVSTNFGTITPNTSLPFYMGIRAANGYPGSGSLYNGALDEVSIYSRALSSNEISAIYEAGSFGKCPP